jgi:hypothetical protein
MAPELGCGSVPVHTPMRTQGQCLESGIKGYRITRHDQLHPPRRHTCHARSAVYHTHAESMRQAKVKRDGCVSGVVRLSCTYDQLRQHELQHHRHRHSRNKPVGNVAANRHAATITLSNGAARAKAHAHAHSTGAHTYAHHPRHCPQPHTHTRPPISPISFVPIHVCVLCGEPERVWLTRRGRG